MNLTDYAISKGGTAKIGCPVLASTASSARCSAATLYMIARGHKAVSARLAVRIADATDNAVAAADLRPDLFRAAAPGLPPGESPPLVAVQWSKRALRARLGLSTDKQLAKVLQLPAQQVEVWPEEGVLPVLPQIQRLLGGDTKPPDPVIPNDFDQDRIVPVDAA
ncbi:TPA: hypothetical protein QEL15_004106 [Stenotrophomonas maltophilia]|nr:hypothetical protein [Stenotrophomonas maltophilia]